jgi:ABC-type polysaccharide/polyol phosphate export permease
MRFNPMAWYADRLRDFLLFGDFTLGLADLVVPLLTLALFPLALAFFRRFSTHFEDFL